MTSHDLLDGKRLLITGLLNRRSIAFHVAAAAQRHGATVLLTSFGDVRRHTEKAAKDLPDRPAIVELDVTDDKSVAAVGGEVERELGGVDGVLHSIALGSPAVVGGSFVAAPAQDAGEAFEVSAHSLAALTNALSGPLADGGGSVVGLSFESRFAWPGYNWMGVAKAALEATARYVASEVGPSGVRVNLVSAGPLRTLSSRAVPGFADLAEAWSEGAPLSWDVSDPTPVADACCFLFSDLARAITGEVLHVDGGMHAVVGAARGD